jgi:ABC-type phosphate/phosphonate transport system substrate-binding protein
MIVRLGMYPFAHLRDAYDTLWRVVRRHLGDGPAELDPDLDLHESWRRSDLLLGQTCGWPLVTQLLDAVTVVGAFDVRAPFASGGRYRSVLVASKPRSVEEWKADPDTVVAQSGPDSLSGWVSLQWAWGGAPPNVRTTGGHVLSMRAVAAGEAHLASIDALSYEFFVESEPAVAARLHVVGHGPSVGTLPLVMANELGDRRDDVRAALAAAVADPDAAAACARLRINGFVPCGPEAYADLPGLLPTH